MHRPLQHLAVDRQDHVFCVRLKNQRFMEDGVEEVGAELARLIDEQGCRKMVLNLGPGDLQCLFSVFLAKLVNLQRRLESHGGAMVLAQTSESTQDIFRATGLEKYFKFYPDEPSAVRALS
jgi:anti-anti-sigma factor